MSENALSRYLTREEISQRAFAASVGVREATVSDWVTGKATPRPAMMARIALATGGDVSIGSWFSDLPEPAGARQ